MSDDDHLRDDPTLPGGPEYDGLGEDAGGTDPDLAGAIGDGLAASAVAVEQLRADLARALTEAHVFRGRLDTTMRFLEDAHRDVERVGRARDVAVARCRELEAANLALQTRVEVDDAILTVEQARDVAARAQQARDLQAASIEAERHAAPTSGPMPGAGPYGDDRALNAYDAGLGDELHLRG